MYLWNRQFVVDPGQFFEGVAGIVEVTEYLNSTGSHKSDVWLPTLVGTVGTVGLTTRVESLAAFEQERSAAFSDAEFQEMAGRVGSCLAANPEDTMWRIAHVAGERGDVPAVSSVVNWDVHPAELEGSIGFAIGMADFQHELNGTTVVVATSQWGRPNAVNMILNYDSIAEFEAASDAVLAEGSFLERLKGAVGRPETIQSGVMRRIT